jgi:hypothetical protein
MDQFQKKTKGIPLSQFVKHRDIFFENEDGVFKA